jgi:hypothetical protein
MKFMFENSDVIFTENNEQIHQYSVNANNIEISFKDIDISYYTPYISFLRADGKTSPLIGMAFGDVVINGIGKRGAVYNFTDEWVTGVAGELKFNIVLKRDKTIINTGIITLYVNESIDNDKITYIDDVAYNALVDRIGVIEQNYVNLETFERRTEETVEFITKKIPYGDRTYIKFSHLTANNTIENLYDALTDYNYIGENNVEYKLYIELGDGTILENIHIKSYSEYCDITSIIRNGYAFKIYIGRMWYNNPTPTITEFIAQHSQIVNYKDIENLVNYEALGDALDGIEELIPYGDRKYYYLSGYTSSNGIRELATTLYDNDEDFKATNVGKFYVELGDGTIIENLYLKRFSGTQGANYYLNSIIRENNTIKVYLGTLPRTTMTISDFINKHSQIATIQDIANLVNSAPETLDTLGEIANALKENDNVVEALNNAISTKADISYVDEKIASAGGTNIPTDLLDRVETLETNKADKTEIPKNTSQLTNDSAFINQTQLDEALANVGGGASGKEIVEITTPLLKIEQTPYGEHINFEFKNEWNNKYIIYDWSIDQQTFDSVQDLQYIRINSSEKILTNLTILIKIPYMGGIINNNTTYFDIYAPKGFVFVENFFNAKTYHEGCRYLDNGNFNDCVYTFETWDDSYHFIKIDFDDNGFATIYLFDSYEV